MKSLRVIINQVCSFVTMIAALVHPINPDVDRTDVSDSLQSFSRSILDGRERAGLGVLVISSADDGRISQNGARFMDPCLCYPPLIASTGCVIASISTSESFNRFSCPLALSKRKKIQQRKKTTKTTKGSVREFKETNESTIVSGHPDDQVGACIASFCCVSNQLGEW